MDFLLTWSTNFPLVDLPLFSFSFAALLALLPSLLPLGIYDRGGKGKAAQGNRGDVGKKKGSREKTVTIQVLKEKT
jgi:hypothetical protein